ncbi:hypothetical protein BD626DRAFT_398083 [Schizophyllum amplum]|uniref:TauD/TfdA-like domain-containing protein n=1 Tax=Schizophyllum amplum TaxID=97359 RepID=A0A550CNA4_9AGAR|nr:hypothetical protein BD626DRAFT_398083 [Auriculariopsis ampla]
MSATATITASSAAPSPVLKLNSTSAEEQTPSTPAAEPYRYAHLLPHFSQTQYPPLTPFEHVDPGHRALARERKAVANGTVAEGSTPLPAFLRSPNVTVSEVTPNLGVEVSGISLSQLDDAARDDLALLVARRGLVIFRGQEEFIDSSPEAYKEWGQYFGRLHIHPTSGHPEGHPEIHLVYRDGNSTFNFERDDSITTLSWHSDVSYELQPPGLTTFFLIAHPHARGEGLEESYSGGDTLFTSQVATFKRLSPEFQEFLRGLKVIHSGFEQADYSRTGRRGGVVRREPVEHIHPLVRKHPVTGEEALYVNRQFTRRIVGLKREESEMILRFLYDHIDKSGDNQARLKWTPYTIALWDNRVTAHSAIVDFKDGKQRRHGCRITPQAERPIPAKEGLQLD